MSQSTNDVAVHTRLGNDYRNWKHAAQALFAGSGILTRERTKATVGLKGLVKNAPIELLTRWIEVMLAAFGIECLIKATWVQAGHKLAQGGRYAPMCQNEGHNLVRLCGVAGIELNADEKDTLERMSIIARSIGRYPISKNAQETRPRTFYRHSGTPFLWSSNNEEITSNFVRRIKTDLRRKEKATT
ncbi:MAG TPA: hypothetical protein VFA58_07090 [Chthoniobacterales bacterium]|nr:hypothetical protein [Chthoniobacterales bacterium]